MAVSVLLGKAMPAAGPQSFGATHLWSTSEFSSKALKHSDEPIQKIRVRHIGTVRCTAPILSLALLSVGNVWVDSHEDASKMRIGPALIGDFGACGALKNKI